MFRNNPGKGQTGSGIYTSNGVPSTETSYIALFQLFWSSAIAKAWVSESQLGAECVAEFLGSQLWCLPKFSMGKAQKIKVWNSPFSCPYLSTLLYMSTSSEPFLIWPPWNFQNSNWSHSWLWKVAFRKVNACMTHEITFYIILKKENQALAYC